jgi:Tol biopolymer transport system component
MKSLVAVLLLATACASTGSQGAATESDLAAQKAVGAKVKGTIVWSSARNGNHDLFVMNTDGTEVRAITHGEEVDWFPRFSPDGSQILFCRSKKGWVYERDANSDGKWDLWTIAPDGSGARKVVDNASWGNWVSRDEIVYVRGTTIFRRKLAGGDETAVMTSDGVPALEGALLQQPELSHDGRFVAITLRGSKRETGIWDLHKKTWTRTGEGCQVNWTPDGSHIYWVHPTGNGGSQVLSMPIEGGQPAGHPSEDQLHFMDLPGRRSHEYFPQLSADGKWMVWGATQRGHDHDTADYEIYIWEVGTPAEGAARLTFHSANDRWPDIFIPGTAATATIPTPEKLPGEAQAAPPAPARKSAAKAKTRAKHR